MAILLAPEAEVIKMARALRGLSEADLEDKDKRVFTYLRAGASKLALDVEFDALAVRYNKTWRDRIAKLKGTTI